MNATSVDLKAIGRDLRTARRRNCRPLECPSTLAKVKAIMGMGFMELVIFGSICFLFGVGLIAGVVVLVRMMSKNKSKEE